MARYNFICIDWRHVGELLEAALLAYTELKNICVWDKGSGGLGAFYRNEHELVLVFKNGTAPHRNNLQLGHHGRATGPTFGTISASAILVANLKKVIWRR